MKIEKNIKELELKTMTRVGKRYINGSKGYWNRKIKILGI
jgi:hypothetical protein